jgi:hypothetical protein
MELPPAQIVFNLVAIMLTPPKSIMSVKRKVVTAKPRDVIGAKIANMGQGTRTDLKLSETSQKGQSGTSRQQLGTAPQAVTQARTIKESSTVLPLMPIPGNPRLCTTC